MRDVNGSSFVLLADPGDWAPPVGMTWTASTWTLAGKQSWRLPLSRTPADAKAALNNSPPVVVDAYGGMARIAMQSPPGMSIESWDGTAWTKIVDQNYTAIAPKLGKFVAMSLGGSRLALVASDGASAFLELFDLSGRWPLDSPENPSIAFPLDSGGTAVATAADGPIFVCVQGGLAIFEGGPIDELFAPPIGIFLPVSPNPNPLRQTALLTSPALMHGPEGGPLAMAVDAERIGILMDQGKGGQTIALLDRASGAWTSTPIPTVSTDGTWLPYMTDIAFMPDGFVALMAPPSPPTSPPTTGDPARNGPLDCAVAAVSSQGLTLAPCRFPMLDQYAPRFASAPGPDVYYLGGSPGDTPVPRRLLPLPYPAYLTSGALRRFAVLGSDPDQVWHRLYAEAYLPQETALTIWARAAELQFDDVVGQATAVVEQTAEVLSRATFTGDQTAIAAAKTALANAQSDLEAAIALTGMWQPAWMQAAADQHALVAILLAAPASFNRIGPTEAAAIAGATSPLSPTLRARLTFAPFHRQPPLTAVSQPSELPFHPGLATLAGAPGGLYEVLLQRCVGNNRRLTGAFLDLVVLAGGDGRHSPCLRAIRVYSPRFSYQDAYLPIYLHQTRISDESDVAATASAPDFRERLLANFEGLLTPIENRAAAAEYLLDPNAAPASMLPWLFTYFGCTLDPSWPEARSRRALATMGRQFRQRGTYRGVCLALDVATDGAVARGEVVVLETFRLRRSNATVLGIPMSGRNSLTGSAVPSGNSIVGDTLTLSADRSVDLLTMLGLSVPSTKDPAMAAQLLDEYADRFQVTVLLQGQTAAALRPVVSSVLKAELPAQLGFDIVMTDQRFILGLSPLLDVDTFLDPPTAPALLTLGKSVVGRDAIVRNPAALRQ